MADTPSTPSKTEEQLHYESITKIIIFSISFGSLILGIIIAFGIYFSYQNAHDMREEYSRAITDMRQQLSDLKADAKEKTQSIREDAKATQEFSEKEISRIKTTTNDIALRETQKNIDAIFATDKIQNLIENQAVKEIKSKLPEIIDEETKGMSEINDAASLMRVGNYNGEIKLKSYFTSPKNKRDSLQAKNLYDGICADYEKAAINYHKKIPYLPGISIVDNKMPTDAYPRDVITNLVGQINSDNYDLNSNSIWIDELNHYAHQSFKCFDYDTINKWFNGLQK